MRESIVSTTSQTVKEVLCAAVLLIAALLYICLARLGPHECLGLGSKMDDWAQPTVVFLLGGQLAVFHNLGLMALL
jgi:hypothetical protein